MRFAHGCTLNKPTVLSNGDWLLPVSLWKPDSSYPESDVKDLVDNDWFGPQRLDPVRIANVFVSSDHGQTWTRRGGVKFPNTDSDEHMIVERNDGSLWMLARNGCTSPSTTTVTALCVTAQSCLRCLLRVARNLR